MNMPDEMSLPFSTPFAGGRRLPGRTGWRKTALAILVGVALMAAGAVVGAGLSIVYFRNRMIPDAGGAERMGRLLHSSIAGGVALTEEEKSEIDAIVRTGVGDVETLNRKYGAVVQDRFGEMCRQICGVLGTERAKEWECCIRRDFGDRAVQRMHGRMGGREER